MSSSWTFAFSHDDIVSLCNFIHLMFDLEMKLAYYQSENKEGKEYQKS